MADHAITVTENRDWPTTHNDTTYSDLDHADLYIAAAWDVKM
jgi:hypothetical protein